MSDVPNTNVESAAVSDNKIKPVVSDTNQLNSRVLLDATTLYKRAILFLYDSNNFKLKSDFYDTCNEYLDKADYNKFGVAWCDYSAFDGKYKTKHESGELRFVIINKYWDNTFTEARSADGLATALKKALEKDIYITCRCICAAHEMYVRKHSDNINAIADILNFNTSISKE
ncbi:hypothetical protein IWW38_000036 [Coemansia aciculifera]|uniref:Uncharacterized protein n=1 Tax=Coemansia aciculifera TaxID=417176 RepID=A0ACC1MBT3_9FUNG|nr:hypothetical protein IWW38_000036 [Coemansia aciculifera]